MKSIMGYSRYDYIRDKRRFSQEGRESAPLAQIDGALLRASIDAHYAFIECRKHDICRFSSS